MKPNVRILSLVAFMVSLVTSCVNEGLQEPQDASALKMIPSLEEQTVAVEASMEELHELQAALESNDVKLEGMAAAEQQAAVISKGGASLEEGTLAAFELQKQIARILGPAVASLDSEIYESEFKERFDALELGISKWVGKDFVSLYPAALAEAVTKAAVADLDGQLSRQKLYVDALASDVEAGLRNDEKPGELISLAASVQETAANSEKLASELTALASEVEEEYEAAVKSIISDPSGFDGAALKQFNSNVGVELASADNTLESLSARVAACEVQLSAILERLGSLETEIEDLEGLLEMVQSVTFMSKYSEDKAVAYYTMNVSGAPDAQGRKPRTPDGTIELQYVVRPASAAAALTSSSMWNDGLKIFGYYAESITKAAGDFFDFTITNVTADQTTGVATITVNNALSSSFFFKEIGAKVALSLATGETDLTSKFVEIVPKDKSDNVYVESLTLSDATLEIDNGETAVIKATVSPSDVTTGGVTWASNNTDVLTVAADGTITTKAVGTAVVTATTKGVDEWGNALTATCTVKVNPSIKIFGSDSVEEGKTTTLTVQSPTFISPEYITWEVGTFTSKNADGTPSGFSTNQAFASVDDSGNVSGLKMYYNTSDTVKDYVPLMVKCTIDGAVPVVLYHEIRVIAVQPLGISINGLSDADTEIYTKQGAGIDLTATIKPAEVNSEYFKVSGLATGYVAFEGYFAASEIGVADVSYSIQPGGTGKYNYFYPKREKVSRNIRVIVEPHWVTGMDLFIGDEEVEAGSVVSLNAGSSTHVNVKLLSDTASEATDKTVTWTSSNPEYVSVDNDGNISASANAIGKLVTITVTTSGSNSVPNGSSHKSVSFQIDVTEAWHEFNVGDYVLRYNSDGSIGFWNGSGSQPSGSTVVGIVIAKENPRITDTRLPEYCTHGIAMALGESSAVQWWIGSPDSDKTSYSSVDSYAKAFGYVSTIAYKYVSYDYFIQDSGKSPYGYDHTSALKAFLKYCTDNGIQYRYHNNEWDKNNNLIYYYEVMSSEMVTALNNYSVGRPSETSEWYFPSFYEMNLIFENKDIMNSRLSGVGSQLTDELYWTVSECGTGTYAMVVNPITGAKNYSTVKHQTSGGTPVRKKTRFIFAF